MSKVESVKCDRCGKTQSVRTKGWVCLNWDNQTDLCERCAKLFKEFMKEDA